MPCLELSQRFISTTYREIVDGAESILRGIFPTTYFITVVDADVLQ